ncbi:hypothetical protein JCM8547_005986 [Rhodosporidiobolus lusitaniae]
MLVLLTACDSVSDQVALCSCFVFSLPPLATEEERASLVVCVKEAAQRVVERWKMLQGTPEWTKDGVWAIRIPDDEDEQRLTRSTVGFSTATYEQPYHLVASVPSPLPPLSSAPSSILPAPQLSFFRPSTILSAFSTHAKHAFPLVHIHVSLFSDSVAVGVSVPHGLLDGTGVGMLNRALSAELHGKEWTPPPLPEDGKNPFVAALEALDQDEAAAAELRRRGDPSLKHSWRTMSVVGMLCFVVSILVEKLWWKSEWKRAFFRREMVERVVEKTKREVKEETGGKEYVSTGDVLAAWLLKASLADESNKNERVAAASVFNLRPLLSDYAPTSLSTYACNCALPYQLAFPLSLSTLSSTPLSALALSFRRNLAKYHNLPSLLSLSRWMRSSPSFVPLRDWPSFLRPFAKTPYTHRWIFTNQTSLGMADISLPFPSSSSEGRAEEDLPLTLYHLGWDMPLDTNNILAVQSVPGGGVTLCGNMRRSRWEALQRAVEELEAEGDT